MVQMLSVHEALQNPTGKPHYDDKFPHCAGHEVLQNPTGKPHYDDKFPHCGMGNMSFLNMCQILGRKDKSEKKQ